MASPLELQRVSEPGLKGLTQNTQAQKVQPLQYKVPFLQLRGTGDAAKVLLVTQPQTLLMPPSLWKGLPTALAVCPRSQLSPPVSARGGQWTLSSCARFHNPTPSTSCAVRGSRADPPRTSGARERSQDTPCPPGNPQNEKNVVPNSVDILSLDTRTTSQGQPGLQVSWQSRVAGGCKTPESHRRCSKKVTAGLSPKSKSLGCLCSQHRHIITSLNPPHQGQGSTGTKMGDSHQQPSSTQVTAVSGINYSPA